MNNEKLFYCYSINLMHFLKSMGFKYVFASKNHITNRLYFAFTKTKQLDTAIGIWNKIKFSLKETEHGLS